VKEREREMGKTLSDDKEKRRSSMKAFRSTRIERFNKRKRSEDDGVDEGNNEMSKERVRERERKAAQWEENSSMNFIVAQKSLSNLSTRILLQ
jgi:hypothetical protein